MKRREDLPVRRTYRFRIAGLIYLTVTGFLAIAAISSQNNLLFWCLGLAVAGIAVSGLISGAGLMGIRAEREAIPDASAGSPMIIRYRIRNTNWFAPAFGLTIAEREPPRRRRVMIPWQRCLTRPVAFVACVRPGQTVTAEALPLATARGEPEFTDFVIASTFPFGLASKSLRFVQSRTALVYPQPTPVRASVLETLRAGGERDGAVRSSGGSLGDFYGIREYVPGDPLRSVVWSASARVGELVVKQHARPAPKRLWVRLELPDPLPDETRESTISLAAGVLQLAAEQGYAVGLLAPELGLSARPAIGQRGLRNALGRLATIGGEAARDAPTAADLTPGRRDLVITVRPRYAEGERTTTRIVALDTPATWQNHTSHRVPRRAGAPLAGVSA
ncbi:hypothetical protein MNBD_PLANCTO03-1629 [hydrothermal vent metagenome]|uniref:DUF58 domain-containing protein n=1 Tax=hydrothermal vent metagenome TaxID=652676 RepID=A0A3B1DIH4_9ZZZZ